MTTPYAAFELERSGPRTRCSSARGPGLYLGAEGHLRRRHALDPSRTSEALERIARVLSGPRPGG